MPYWMNRFAAKSVNLERRDGRGATVFLDPQQSFWGSSFYEIYSASAMPAAEYMLTRTSEMRTIIGTYTGSGNVWQFRTPEPFVPDSLVASEDDEDACAEATEGTAYTMWGSIEWTDAGGVGTKVFSLNGDGRNSNATSPSAVFSVAATSGTATADLEAFNDAAANHYVLAAAGVIRLKFDGAITSASITVNYDPVEGGLNAGTKSPAIGSRTTLIRTFVLAADNTSFPHWYHADSVGQTKTEKIFQTGAVLGYPALLRTFYYEDTNTANPGGNKPAPSRVVEEDSTVTEDDLIMQTS